MFSSMIQNLLSTSGHSSALQRAVQMNNQINNINSQWSPVEKTELPTAPGNNIQSFDKVLQASAKTKFGDLLTNSATRVNAQIYSNSVLKPQGVEQPTRSKIKELILVIPSIIIFEDS